MYFEKILPNNWIGIRRNFQKLESNLFGPTSEPVFGSLTLTGLTDNSLVYPVSGVLTSLGVASNGQLPIGSTGTTPVLAGLTAGAGLVVTNGAGSISVAVDGLLEDLDTLGANAADSEFLVGTGAGALAWESGNTVKTSLGLVIGTNVQAWDTGLDSLAGLGYVSDSFIKITAEDTYAVRTITETKSDLSLNLVENTALSSWAGTASITTLGTIATGTWQSTDVGIAYGGTGQSTAQLAINTLSAVGAATNEHVLTKDTVSGNAIFKAAAGGGGSGASLSAYTNLDSESNAMTKNHAYLAMTDGMIFVHRDVSAASFLKIYVGVTIDPVGDGLLIQQVELDASTRQRSICALVAEGEYFEVTCPGAPAMHWKSFGTLSAPVDYD